MMDGYLTSPLLRNIIELSKQQSTLCSMSVFLLLFVFLVTAWPLKGHQIFFAFAKIALL